MSYVDFGATSCHQLNHHSRGEILMVSHRMNYLMSHQMMMALESALDLVPAPVLDQELSREMLNRWFRPRHLMSHLIRLRKIFVRLAVAAAWCALASPRLHPLTSHQPDQLPCLRYLLRTLRMT
jgi:hypothetical protein